MQNFLAHFGPLVFFSCSIISACYAIKMIFLSFRASILWGLFYLFIPVIGPICFIVFNWDDTKDTFLKGFFVAIVGGLGLMAGSFAGGIGS